ncbi:integrase core domain-containing protein [Tianweitania sediminis]|uniref:Integrase core domain-containing protein n=1 Tax=Tianweitania sediminis TaxID=1502156 RepID=A0A8J7ULG2_9HYPH|nr:integrase core domain-containing protein [Tianweitania sediminis]
MSASKNAFANQRPQLDDWDRNLLFTPVRSPKSNGMSEGFVKTLKREASTVILPDADTIMALMASWIDDYCEVHPHSGLRFRSPREFLRSVPKPSRRLSGETGSPPCSDCRMRLRAR